MTWIREAGRKVEVVNRDFLKSGGPGAPPPVPRPLEGHKVTAGAGKFDLVGERNGLKVVRDEPTIIPSIVLQVCLKLKS